MDDMRELMQKAKQRGIKIVMDLVVLNNFTAESQTLTLPEHLMDKEVECLIANLDSVTHFGSQLTLTPYQSIVVKL